MQGLQKNISDLFLIFFPEAALFLLIRKLQCVVKIHKVIANLVQCSHSPFAIQSFVSCTLLRYLWPFKQQGWNNFRYLKCFRQHMCGQNPVFTQEPYRHKHLCTNSSVLSSDPYKVWQSSHDGFGTVFERCLDLKFPFTCLLTLQWELIKHCSAFFWCLELCENRAVRANPTLDRTAGSAARSTVFS